MISLCLLFSCWPLLFHETFIDHIHHTVADVFAAEHVWICGWLHLVGKEDEQHIIDRIGPDADARETLMSVSGSTGVLACRTVLDGSVSVCPNLIRGGNTALFLVKSPLFPVGYTAHARSCHR